jgi:ABC-type phosphate transport system auxiliary subunit
MEKVHVTPEELQAIQQLNDAFNKAKLELGDLELTKQDIIREIDGLRVEFAKHETDLVEKYGKDFLINIQTGEVTKNTK